MKRRQEDEDELLRDVALQNARTVRLARERAEKELVKARDALERKTGELAHSLAMMRATLESTTDGILVTDRAGRITDYNNNFAAIWNPPRELLDQRDHRKLAAAVSHRFKDPEGYLERVEAIYASSPKDSFDSLELLDGRVFERHSRVQYIGDEVVGRVWSFRDITERRRSEKRLREERQVLELLNRTGKMIAGQLDLQSLVQSVTDAATELSGARFGAFFYNVANDEGESYMLYTLSGAKREDFAKFGMPRNTAVFAPTFDGEGVIRSPDITKDPRYGKASPHHGMPKGHLPVRSYLAVPVISRSGETIGGLFFGHPDPDVFSERSERVIVGVAAQAAVAIDNARLYEAAQKEIVERKRTEAALRESEQRFRVVADAAPVLIRVAGTDKLCTYFNRGWLDFVGRTMEEELGDGWMENVHPEDSDRFREKFNAAFDQRRSFEVEFRLRHQSGEYRWVLDRGVPRFGPDGVFEGFIGGCTDIDDQKRSEEKLERQVAERTASLKESVDTLESLCYTMAHDLRAPLRTVQGYTRIILADYASSFDEQGRELADRIVHGAVRMDMLISDLLDYAKISRSDLPCGHYDLTRLVQSVLDKMEPEIETKRAKITVQSLPSARVHSFLFERILTNLLTNALKFVNSGVEPRVRIWAEEEDHRVRMFVHDNGIGIKPEYHERIFEVFHRLHPDNTQYPGTGVGLAIVKKGMERMGGEVFIDPEVCEGTCFELCFRAASDNGMGAR